MLTKRQFGNVAEAYSANARGLAPSQHLVLPFAVLLILVLDHISLPLRLLRRKSDVRWTCHEDGGQGNMR